MQAIKRCEDHRFDYRVITAERRTRRIRDTVRLKCERGQPTRVYGVMIDATASQEQQQREAFTSTFDEAPIGMVHIEDVTDRVRLEGQLRQGCTVSGSAAGLHNRAGRRRRRDGSLIPPAGYAVINGEAVREALRRKKAAR